MDSYYGYDYYDYSSMGGVDNSGLGAFLAFSGGMLLFSSILGIFMIICMWKVFKKAGKPGWASIVPIYNIIVLIEIAELPMWYIALLFVPFANIYVMFKMFIELAHKFGKSTGFGVGLVFLSIVFYPILAFGSATYNGGGSNNKNENIQSNLGQDVINNQNINQANNNAQNTTIMDFNNSGNVVNELGSNNNTFVPVGNLNNNINGNSESQINQVPEAPVVPVIPEVNQVPETPVVSVTPEVNQVPEAPVVPITPEVNQVPEAPVVPITPEVNQVPEAPVVPVIPEVNSIPNNQINNN